MSTRLVVQFPLQVNCTHELVSSVGEWEKMAAVCEHKEFFVGKFVVIFRRMGALYLQLCNNLAACMHKGFDNRNPM